MPGHALSLWGCTDASALAREHRHRGVRAFRLTPRHRPVNPLSAPMQVDEEHPPCYWVCPKLRPPTASACAKQQNAKLGNFGYKSLTASVYLGHAAFVDVRVERRERQQCEET